MADLSMTNLPILTEKNCSRWSTQMRVLFRVQGINNVVERVKSATESRGTEEQKEEFRKKDGKALLIIHQCVDDTQF